jgi:transcription elongation factor GreA
MLIFFTKEKFAQIKQEYAKLLIERKDTVAHLTKARDMGDLSENGYYRSSKTKLSSIDFNLRKLSNFIKYGSIINFVSNGIIEIGCTVTLGDDNDTRIKYQIVGKEEADPKIGKISNESPLGKLLLGKKAGEGVEMKTSSGKIVYNILKIE